MQMKLFINHSDLYLWDAVVIRTILNCFGSGAVAESQGGAGRWGQRCSLCAAHSIFQAAGWGCCRLRLLQAGAGLLSVYRIPGFAVMQWHRGALCCFGGAPPASLVSASLPSAEAPRLPCTAGSALHVLATSPLLMFSFTRMSRLFLPFKAWHLRGPSGYSLGNVGIARTFCTVSFKQKQTQRTSVVSVGLL